MKHLFYFSLFLLLLSLPAKAQIRFELGGGMAMNNSTNEMYKQKIGFGSNVGVGYQLAIAKSFYICPSLAYQHNSTRAKWTDLKNDVGAGVSTMKYNYQSHFAQIGCYAGYKISNFSFEVSPYLQYTLAEKSKFDVRNAYTNLLTQYKAKSFFTGIKAKIAYEIITNFAAGLYINRNFASKNDRKSAVPPYQITQFGLVMQYSL